MTFVLDPRLNADTLALGDLGLSCVRLMNDARYTWLILVPRRPGLVELLDLSPADRGALIEEIALCSSALKRIVTPDKLNIGAIGNRVPQLHVHIVARFSSDPAWPDPVWGRGPAVPYGAEAGTARAAAIWSAVALV